MIHQTYRPGRTGFTPEQAITVLGLPETAAARLRDLPTSWIAELSVAEIRKITQDVPDAESVLLWMEAER